MGDLNTKYNPIEIYSNSEQSDSDINDLFGKNNFLKNKRNKDD